MTKVIGIDLGTTFSAIASLDDLGNPEVLTSIEDNRKITASAIYINDKNVVVGDKALNFIASEPNKVILQTKREMENDVVYSINKGNWTNDKDDIESYSPAQVSALILKKLKEYTSDVKRAVITVPAMFAERARQATLEAAKIADIEVIELINEPTAAVLHYASLPGVEIGGRVLIFDLGGGTFDVTIADVKSKSVDVLTSRGDKYLGGKDFDFEITKLMKKKYQEHHDVEIDIENNKEYILKAEEIKKILTVKPEANIQINGPKGLQEIKITLEEFEESIQTYIEKIKMLIEEVMEASGMNASRINQTSALENAETSCVGRALAFCSFISDGIASAEEVSAAIVQQDKKIQEALEELEAVSHKGSYQEWLTKHKVMLEGLKTKNPPAYEKLLENFKAAKINLQTKGAI